MIVIEIVQYCLIAVMSILLGYQMFLSFFALMGKRIQDFSTEQNRKFAIVMPAHNEEKAIVKSLYSMSGLVYPKNKYDLIVIADNCTDNSVNIARSLGAIVVERSNTSNNGESPVLRWTFDQILGWDKNYDAIIVFDADSLVSGNYLEVMNYYLEQGSDVIQGSSLVLSQHEDSRSETTRIEFLFDNYVKPMGRKVLGLEAGLLGNGMCFATDVLRKTPWKAQPLADHLEYGLNLQLKDTKIDFSPEAYVWIPMPVKAENIKSQRHYWQAGGNDSLLKKYAPKLLKAAFRKKSIKYLDRFIDLVTPSLVNTLLFAGVLCGINGLLVFQELIPETFLWIWLGIAGSGIVYFVLGLIAVTKNSGFTLPEKNSTSVEKVQDRVV